MVSRYFGISFRCLPNSSRLARHCFHIGHTQLTFCVHFGSCCLWRVADQASLDRGYGRVLVIKRYTTIIKNHPNRTTDIVVPPPSPPTDKETVSNPKKMARWADRNKTYEAIGPDGICEVGSRVEPGWFLLNRKVPRNTTDILSDPSAVGHSMAPVKYKEPDAGTVHRVVVTSTSTSDRLIKVQVRDLRRPASYANAPPVDESPACLADLMCAQDVAHLAPSYLSIGWTW